MRKLSRTLVAINVFILFAWPSLSVPVGAQVSPPTGSVQGAFVPPAGWDDAMHLINNIRTRNEGVQKLYAMAAANPKTIQAAQCLATAVMFDSDRSKAVQVYESFVRDYPGTGIAVQGRLGLLNLRWFSGESRGNTYISEMNLLLAATGAPTLAEINRNRGKALSKLRSLPSDVQAGLYDGYEVMHQILSGSTVNRIKEGLPLAMFGLEAFGGRDSTASSYWLGAVRVDLRQLVRDPGPEPRVTTNPVVNLRSPKGKKSGARPLISIETYTGDYLHSQPSMGLSKVLLDGVDIKPILVTKTKFANSLKKGEVFETIRLKGRPVTPLAAGSHTLDITIQCPGYRGGSTPGLTHITQVFNVNKGERDEDDDDDPEWGEVRD